ncbi:MAG TPA: ABC transporter permease [Acidobacteriota bacterium]|nr:ABC transporter permease [Acidobacteriota bacterium]
MEPARRASFRLMMWLCRRLGLLYPQEVRRSCGPQMEHLLEDLAREAYRGGPAARLRFWTRALSDLLLRGADARLKQIRRSLARGVLSSAVQGRGGIIVGTLRQDLSFAWRSLRRNPLFTIVAVLTLALAIGANSAIFSLVNGVLLQPLPYPDPDRIVTLWSTWRGQPKGQLSMAEFLDFRDQVESLEHVSIWSSGSVNLTGQGEPERVRATLITPSLQQVLSIRPHLGSLLPADAGRVVSTGQAQDTDHYLALMGHALWMNRFGGDPALVGETLQIDGVPAQIVGILPPGFRLPTDIVAGRSTDLILPLTVKESYDRSIRGWHQYAAAALIKDGFSLQQADAEVRQRARRFTEQGLYPEEGLYGAFLTPLKEEVVGPSRDALWVLLAAVGFLLLIACANVAGLQMARSDLRRLEMDLRSALGAGRGRLMMQLLTENVLLALLGGAAGLFLAMGLVELLVTLGPASVPRLQEAALDWRVALFTLLVSFFTGLLFGIAPALRWSRSSHCYGLGGQRVSTAGAPRQRLRSAVVVAEVALCVVLVISAGLTVRSLYKLSQVDPGFDPDNLLVFFLGLPEAAYPDEQAVEDFHRRLLEQIRALPSVRHAASFRGLPLTGSIGDWDFEIEGRPLVEGNEPVGDWQVVTPDYFATMGMRLLKGRAFSQADRRGAQHVVVVNQALAETYFPDSDPLGQRISQNTRGQDKDWATIVGVVENVRQVSFARPPNSTFYRPMEQFHEATGLIRHAMWVGVRGSGDAAALVPSVRQALAQVDPQLPLSAAAPFSQIASRSLSAQRFVTLLLALFALSALGLACVGIYGVLAYSVNRRRREIGIRMALGADARRLLTMVLGSGLRLSLIGLLAGVLLTLSAGGVLQAVLFGVTVSDPLTYAAIVLILLASAMAASYLPARRAVRVDPIAALRSD